MVLNHFGLSREVTGGKPIEPVKQIDGEFGRVISQLSRKSHYIENPKQALDLVFNLRDGFSYRDDKSFIYGLLYILGEYVKNSGDYDINGIDKVGLEPNAVNEVRNRQGFISGQVFEILRNPEKHPENTNGSVIQIDFESLSQSITKFLVSDASTQQRTKIQAIREIIKENLDIADSDWPTILHSIRRKFQENTQQKEAA